MVEVQTRHVAANVGLAVASDTHIVAALNGAFVVRVLAVMHDLRREIAAEFQNQMARKSSLFAIGLAVSIHTVAVRKFPGEARVCALALLIEACGVAGAGLMRHFPVQLCKVGVWDHVASRLTVRADFSNHFCERNGNKEIATRLACVFASLVNEGLALLIRCGRNKRGTLHDTANGSKKLKTHFDSSDDLGKKFVCGSELCELHSTRRTTGKRIYRRAKFLARLSWRYEVWWRIDILPHDCRNGSCKGLLAGYPFEPPGTAAHLENLRCTAVFQVVLNLKRDP